MTFDDVLSHLQGLLDERLDVELFALDGGLPHLVGQHSGRLTLAVPIGTGADADVWQLGLEGLQLTIDREIFRAARVIDDALVIELASIEIHLRRAGR